MIGTDRYDLPTVVVLRVIIAIEKYGCNPTHHSSGLSSN